MAFDEKSFRSFYAGKTSPEKIEAEVAKQKSYELADSAPNLSNVPSGAMPPVANSNIDLQREQAKNRNDAAIASTTTPTPVGNIPTNMLGVGGTILGSAALGAAGTYLYNKSKKTPDGAEPPPPPPPPPPPNAEPTATTPEPQSPNVLEDRINAYKASQGIQQQPVANVDPIAQAQAKQIAARNGLMSSAMGQTPVQTPDPVQTPVNNKLITPESPLANPEFPNTGAPVTFGDSPIDGNGQLKVPDSLDKSDKTKPNIQNTEPTPAGKAVRQKLTFDDTPQTAKNMLSEGTTFMPGYGPGDNHLFNTYGNEGRKDVINKFNDGKPVGSYNSALELEKQVQGVRAGPEISPALRTQRGIPPSGFGNFGALGKALKLGGVAGLGIAASNIANAAQNGNYMEAGLRGADLASDYIPGVAQVKQAFTPMNAGDPDEDAKMAAIHAGQKIGGGRGIAPPSSYIPVDPVDPKKQWEDMKKAGLVFSNYGSSNNKFK